MPPLDRIAALARNEDIAVAPLEVRIQPQRVFKRSADMNRLQEEYALFTLAVISSEPTKLQVDEMVLTHRAGPDTRIVKTYAESAVRALDLVPTVPATPARPSYPVAAFQIAVTQPTALGIDSIVVELKVRQAGAAPERVSKIIPLEVYTQRTSLIFPFRGRGMITQGGAWNDGHRNRSGMFAVDALGLNESYAPMLKAGDDPDALVGWGRPILAPAAGEVVVARNDRPDQPVSGVSDPKYYVAEFPNGGDPGNHCVIDHGNGEFSMLAHFRSGSLSVKVGDRVSQGQPLGQLGNSGDTSSPHVHHQLQSGPLWTTADALPHYYENGPGKRHDRGVMFNAS